LLQSSAMEEPSEKNEKINSLSEYELAIERTRLANDRTILSFIRTSLYFGIAGLTIDSLLHLSFGRLIDILFWIIAIVNLTLGVISYLRLKRKLKAVKADRSKWQLLLQEDE
jgi:inner membrane protein YidH